MPDELRVAVLKFCRNISLSLMVNHQVQPSRTGKYHSLTAQLRFEELEQVHACMQTCCLC
jgi:putative lipoic acid-binding regulatory protein